MFPSHSLVVLLSPLVFLHFVIPFMPLVVLRNMDVPSSSHPLPAMEGEGENAVNIRTSRERVLYSRQ